MQKRKLIFLASILLLITGCTKLTNDLDGVVNAVFENKNIAVNTVSTNYELYLPIGVKQEIDSEYNQKFKIKNRYIYLYVDTISYFYKNALNYKSNNSYNYYYKELNFDNKTGYIGIDKTEDNLYYVEIVYNYSKVEFYTDSSDLPYTLANALIIQKSIKYNDRLISMELDTSNNEGRELKYQLDRPKDAQSTFSDFLQEYVPEETQEIELPDDDNLRRYNDETIGQD